MRFNQLQSGSYYSPWTEGVGRRSTVHRAPMLLSQLSEQIGSLDLASFCPACIYSRCFYSMRWRSTAGSMCNRLRLLKIKGATPVQRYSYSRDRVITSKISGQPRTYFEKTHRICTWGGAPCTNPSSCFRSSSLVDALSIGLHTIGLCLCLWVSHGLEWS